MWSRLSISALAVAGALTACTSLPGPERGASIDADSGRAQTSEVTGGAAAAVAPPTRAVADFERALAHMAAGNDAEAQLELQQLALAFPRFPGPRINLGILHRKAGRLEESEQALREAVELAPASASAWSELGVTLRMRGEFQDALASYERAMAADPGYAPAHRNAGVLLDLYLDQPERALAAFERYRELTGEDKPVSGWIAELKQRSGRPAAAAAEPAGSTGGD